MMNLGIQIEIKDELQPSLRQLERLATDPDALVLPVARQGASYLRGYYRGRNEAEPNRLGGRRTYWWNKVASSVENPILRSPTEAAVSITQPGMALKVHGGTVRPKNAKALAIPIHGDAHGVMARDWNAGHPERPLFMIRSGSRVFLAAKVADSRSGAQRRKTGAHSQIGGRRRLQLLYILKKSQEIPRDPAALPAAEHFGDPLMRYAQQRLSTLIRRK